MVIKRLYLILFNFRQKALFYSLNILIKIKLEIGDWKWYDL